MQLSAISFSVCCDDDEKITELISNLSKVFKVLYNKEVELMTVRYFNADTISNLTNNKIVLLEQRSRYTVQMVMKNQILE